MSYLILALISVIILIYINYDNYNYHIECLTILPNDPYDYSNNDSIDKQYYADKDGLKGNFYNYVNPTYTTYEQKKKNKKVDNFNHIIRKLEPYDASFYYK